MLVTISLHLSGTEVCDGGVRTLNGATIEKLNSLRWNHGPLCYMFVFGSSELAFQVSTMFSPSTAAWQAEWILGPHLGLMAVNCFGFFEGVW